MGQVFFVASTEATTSLGAVASIAFRSLGLSETEERFSSNYPPDDHYFVGYASNVIVKVCDSDGSKEGYPFHLALEQPTYRRGSGAIATESEQVASALAQSGLRVFLPIGAWSHANWDGRGIEYVA